VFAGTRVAVGSSVVSEEVVLLVVLLVEELGRVVLVVVRLVRALVDALVRVVLEVDEATWAVLSPSSPPPETMRTPMSATTTARGTARIRGLFRGLSPRRWRSLFMMASHRYKYIGGPALARRRSRKTGPMR
jgi:hypothetical protein